MIGPSLEEAYAKAAIARSSGQRMIRLEVDPSKRYGQRFVRLWDSVMAKVVGRRVERRFVDGAEVWEVRALVLEMNAIDVDQAMRRKVLRDAKIASEPASPNRIGTTRRPIPTAR